MDFKSQIETILRSRKAELKNVETEEKRVSGLRSHLARLCAKLRGLEDGQGAAKLGIEAEVASLEAKKADLLQAEGELGHIRGRFDRKTINIGVGGCSQQGKSTLLLSLSGLTTEQIPKGGEGKATTAVTSRIFNYKGAPYADVVFHTGDSFLKVMNSHIKTLHDTGVLADNAPSRMDTLSDFESFTVPEGIGEDTSKAAQNSLEKLRDAQNALPRYRKWIGEPNLRLDKLEDLRKYVAYPSHQENGDSEHLYLAVKDVEIHCDFKSLEDVHLGLVDLPGFGEMSAYVDEIQTQGLKNDVDHVLILIRSNAAQIVGKEFQKAIDTVRGIRKDIKERGNFASILINKKGNEEDSIVATRREEIEKLLNQSASASKHKIYAADATDKDAAAALLNEVLEDIALKLPRMDAEILESFRAKQNIAGIRETLESIREKIFNASRMKPGDGRQILDKSVELRDAMAMTFKRAKTRMLETSFIEEEYYNVIEGIRSAVEGRINDGLFRGEGWEKFAHGQIATHGGPLGFFENECNRIRIQIALYYEELDRLYYQPRLETFLEYNVAQLFKTDTGVFLSGELTGRKAVETILGKLRNVRKIDSFEKAFSWILSLRFDFRQSVYPDLRDALQEIEAFVPSRDPPSLLDMNQIHHTDQVGYLKEFLLQQALSANYNIAQCLKEKADLIGKFIYAALEHFDDVLIRLDEKQSVGDFYEFCNQFRGDLWPDEYGRGVNTDSAQYADILEAIDAAIAAIGV